MTTEKAAEKKLPGWRRLYGYWAIMPGLCVNTWCGYGMWFTSFGPFVTSFVRAFGISRAGVMAVVSTANLCQAVGPLLGNFMDRVGYRKAALAAIATMMLGALLIAFSVPPHFWMIWVAYLLLNPVGLSIPTYGGATKTINFWFLKRRGLMTGIMTMVTGAVYMSAAFQGTFITQYGYPGGAWYIFGLGCLMLLATIFVIRNRAEDMGVGLDGTPLPAKAAATDGGQKEAAKPAGRKREVKIVAQLTGPQALRSRALWAFLVSYCLLVTIANQFMATNYVPFLQGMGVSLAAAGAIWGLMGFCGWPSRFIFGPILDFLGRGSERWLFAIGEAMLFISILGLLQVKTAQDFFWIWWWTVWWGFGWGGCMTAMLVMLGTYFGPAAYGTIFGIRSVFMAVGGFLGPITGGLIYDATKSYTLGFMILLGCLALAVVVICFATPPKLGPDGKLIAKAKA